MVDRQEIPQKIKLAVFDRAGGNRGELACEECSLRLHGKPFQYHHEISEWVHNLPKAERPPITPEDVKLLGQSCCHAPITAREAGERAHGVRIVKRRAKAEKPKGRPMMGSRASGWKAKFGGGGERR